ncbi:MAG: adenylate/guanylate cyclase domain-containing protein [Rhodospirillaceae bacterium]|nr:adenylate/guanylate cyclase domain-containing protein [Rhodospirillaceae bacterium]
MRSNLRHMGERFGLARAIALPLLALLLWVRVEDPTMIEALRLRSFDLMQKLAPREVEQYPVQIVDIDEASIVEIGQWPWPRTILAELVDRLMASGAAVVGFDILFAEPDRTSPAMIAHRLDGIDPATRALLESLPDHDEIFAETLARCRCVLGYSVLESLGVSANENPVAPAAVAEIGGDPRPFLYPYPGVLSNLPALEAAAVGRGLFTLDPEQDGLVRRVPLLMRVGDTILPALAPELLRVATGQTTYAVQRNEIGIETLTIAGVKVPTDEQGQVWIRFGLHDQARFVSAGDVLAGRLAPEQIAGRIVLIGTSAVGLRDLRATPVDLTMPGVEIHAQLIETVLAGEYLRRPNFMLGAELVATCIFGLLLIGLVPAVRASLSFGVLALALGGAAAGSWYFFIEKNLLIDPSYPAATAGMLYGLLVYLSHYRTERQRRQTAEAFGRYLSPVMAERVSRDRNALKLGGDERVLTVMFADARGFTALSERYAGDPQTLTGIVNKFLTAMSDEVQSLDGTVDKYMGDAVMAFWNAPVDQPDHARVACHAALAMQSAIGRLNEAWQNDPEFAEEGRTPPRIGVGVGINTGRCVVGNMGSETRLEYSALGDPVNLASRIESQTKRYSVPIIVTAATEREAPGLAVLEIDRIAVKGKAEAVTIFALLGDETRAASPSFQALRAAQASFLDHYRGQRWNEARRAAADLAASEPALAGLCGLYAERIAVLEETPPAPDWDGAYIADEK